MSINKKVGILTAIAIVTLGAYIFTLHNGVTAVVEASNDFKQAGSTENCQYPMRPLVNGNCDNSDPAVPECIKAPDEAECARNYQPPATPAPAPVPAPKPTNQCSN